MKIGNHIFDFTSEKPYIMGILNVTPDSFSDGGRFNSLDHAKRHALQLLEEGADIIDVGAESTRPGHTQISIDEELERLLPVLEALREITDAPISVDTYRAPVAEAALSHGAHMINDIWGLTYDDKMATVVAKAKCPVCIMHNRNNNSYSNFMHEFLADIQHQLDIALAAGIQKDCIILDPGVGFAKNFELDAEVLYRLNELCQLNYPVLLGTSRKRLIGNLLDLPVTERDEGTAATTIYGYMQGARIFRVHNVKISRRCVDTIYQLEKMKREQH